MAYQLRSRKDPTTTETQEQTDTLVGDPTEIQVTTSSPTMFVPPQLSEQEHIALPIAEASQFQSMSDIPTKPEAITNPQLDIEGPTRLDPGLGSATLSAGMASTGTPSTTQQLAPAEASAVTLYQYPLTETVGPPSAVIASRDISLTGNQTTQFYGTIDTPSHSISHDSQEVKQQNTGTTQY